MKVALGMQSPQCREKQQHQDPGEYSGAARALALGAGMSAPGGAWPTAVVAAGRALVQKQDLLSPDPAALVELVRPSQDPKFGDYQANCAMPLAKQLGKPPRQVAQEIVARLDLAELCEPPEIAGPGFINLRIRDDWLAARLEAARRDDRLGVPISQPARTYVVDFSAPNVAKPMHVGHIRSTVIGDALYRTLKFLGQRVVGDNHIGDWGTQFGMIIYGFKHFCDAAAYAADPVAELGRLYKLVNRLVEYHELVAKLPFLERNAAQEQTVCEQLAGAPENAKNLKRQQARVRELRDEIAAVRGNLDSVANDPVVARLAGEHPKIGGDVLAETAKLHAGDAENTRLWTEFLPPCLEEIERVYRRLGVTFDVTHGESFYHERLPQVVADLVARGLAKETQGAIGVFLDGYDTPFLIRKQDGAYLYATSDLATIQYRVQTWRPDALLYVVDHRQSLHFEQLFATARLWGYDRLEMQHVSFGTVLGDDGRPFKTRSGDTVGLWGLLDEAVARAHAIVSANDDAKKDGPELDAAERTRVAEAVGIAALKYADLAQNRTSDYVFSYDKMLAMNGNTATYLQYAYARVRNIFSKGGVDSESLRRSDAPLSLAAPEERALAVELLRFGEALDATVGDYRPNHLTGYLYDLANRYSTFYENCPVLKADSDALRASRLLLCDLTARTLKQGLALLGIDVVERM